MKNFKFRLQTVLEQRERQEKAAQLSFAEADLAYHRAEQLLAELRDIRAALITELGIRRNERFDAAETRLYQEYMQIITTSIKQQETHLIDLSTTREALKLHMVGATQNRQVLDKVKTRDKNEHTKKEEKASQTALDDLTCARFASSHNLQEKSI